jgi:hypothetical protein
MAAGLARTAALAIRREFMMDRRGVRMQLLVCQSLTVNLRTRSSALGGLAEQPPPAWLAPSPERRPDEHVECAT